MDKPGSHLEALDVGRQTRRLTTILVADICGYSRMSEKDEEAAIRTADLLYKLFEDITEKHGGRVFKRIADGFLAEYPSARSGMQAALDYTKEVKARNNLAPNAISAQVRAGIHVGDVTDRPDGDILGHGVNVAARLQELADPGTILASSNIMNLTRKDIPFKINKRTGLALKNISEPMTAFQIDPEKSGGGFDIQIPKIFKSKALLYTALAGVVLYGAMTVQGQRAEAKLEGRITAIIEENFKKKASAKIEENQISQAYIREVLESLSNSKIPSHKASFALFEAGNINDALEELISSLEKIKFDSDLYVDTLHQIAALSYHHDSAQSVAYYETILELRPNDEVAMFELVNAYHVRLERKKALDLTNRILELGVGSPVQKAELSIDLAFNHILNLDFDTAIYVFEAAKDDVIETNDRRIFHEWQILYGYAVARSGDLDNGEILILASVRELEQIGTDTNLPRAYSALGIISKEKAERSNNVMDRREFLKNAKEYFTLQYERALEINKKRDQVEALYSVGEVHLEFLELEFARQKFLESIKLARSNNYTNSEVRSRLGLAKIDALNFETEKACKQIQIISGIYKTRNTVPMNEKMLGTIEDLNCGFDREDF